LDERVKIKFERSLMEIIKSYQSKFKLKEEDIGRISGRKEMIVVDTSV